MSKKPKVEKDNAERWLLTYADLMNLLLIFFIVLYSMSLIDSKKFNQLAESFRETFGTSSSNTFMTPGGGANSLQEFKTNAPSPQIPEKVEEKQMQETKSSIEKVVKAENLEDKIIISMEERGVKVSINSNLLFKSGSAQLEQYVLPTVEKIGSIIKQFPNNNIRVEGHTDTDKINTTYFPSNWELSSARATTVLRLLVEKTGIDPNNISAIGYGEYKPQFPNTTAENKAKNRRVDIVILKKEFSKGETTSK